MTTEQTIADMKAIMDRLTAERDALRGAVRKLMKACAVDGYACFHHRAHGKPCSVENCPIINAEDAEKGGAK